MFDTISMEEFRSLGSRVAVYTFVAYATIRVARFAIGQASRLVGMVSSKNES